MCFCYELHFTGETPESLHEGKLVTCTVTGIVRRKPSRDILDRANPIKNQMTGYWQCPFCLQAHFTDLSLVCSCMLNSEIYCKVNNMLLSDSQFAN